MLFNSLQFALFFPLVTLLYFALPHRWRGHVLLVASCQFYMAFVPVYIAASSSSRSSSTTSPGS